MRKLILFLFCIILLTGCSSPNLLPQKATTEDPSTKETVQTTTEENVIQGDKMIIRDYKKQEIPDLDTAFDDSKTSIYDIDENTRKIVDEWLISHTEWFGDQKDYIAKEKEQFIQDNINNASIEENEKEAYEKTIRSAITDETYIKVLTVRDASYLIAQKEDLMPTEEDRQKAEIERNVHQQVNHEYRLDTHEYVISNTPDIEDYIVVRKVEDFILESALNYPDYYANWVRRSEEENKKVDENLEALKEKGEEATTEEKAPVVIPGE